MAINFDETGTMHTKSDSIDILIGNKTDEIIKELFDSLLESYQKGLEESMKGSEFIFDSVGLLYCKFHKISLVRGESYIDLPKWLKNKKTTRNPISSDEKCFQYATTVALNYQDIKNNPERKSKNKPFINQYNWKEINFLSHKKDWKKLESNNKSIALNILYVPYNTDEIPVIFHNSSNYDYHFIIKELAEVYKGQFEYLGENTEKYITFSVPIKKELDNGKIITYKIKFIDSFRFMSSSLTSLVDNLSEGLRNDKRTDCKSFLKYIPTINNYLIFKCLKCNKIYEKEFNNVYEFCNGDINKFILLLRKIIYLY